MNTMISAGNPLTFTGNPLDRAENQRLDADWVAARLLDPKSRLLPYRNFEPFIRDGRLGWLDATDIGGIAGFPWVLLGIEGDSAKFAVDLGAKADIAGGEFQDARTVAAFLPLEESAIVAQGKSLLDWHARHGFCAKCGAPTRLAKAGAQRICTAESCKAEHFPRVDPVAIMLVTRTDARGDYCLMGRQPRFPPGMYSALAGFIEPGESLEEAVAREIWEEAGLRVRDVRYMKSQPWPYPSSLMIGCRAIADDDKLTPDMNELDDLQWFTRDQVKAVLSGDKSLNFFVPPRFAIAHHLLRDWAEDS